MKKRNLLLSILLTLVILFPMNAFAAEGIQDGTEMEDGFVLIKGGTFQMGSPADEPERSSDETQHSVTIGDFYMAKTEVSQEDYQAVMGIRLSRKWQISGSLHPQIRWHWIRHVSTLSMSRRMGMGEHWSTG